MLLNIIENVENIHSPFDGLKQHNLSKLRTMTRDTVQGLRCSNFKKDSIIGLVKNSKSDEFIRCAQLSANADSIYSRVNVDQLNEVWFDLHSCVDEADIWIN